MVTTDTTQQGVEAEEVDGEKVVGTHNDRDDFIAAIGKKVIEDRGQAPVSEEPEQQEEVEAKETPEPEPEKAPEPELVKIKVDGVEEFVTQAEVDEAGGIRSLQKERAADKRLKEAARLLREAQDTTQKIQQPSNDAATHLPEEDDAALARAIQTGTEEEAMAAIAKIKKQTANQPDVTSIVRRQVAEELDFKDGVKHFADNFKEIVQDPLMMKLAMTMEQDRRAAGDNRPYKDLYNDIGLELRKWRGSPTPEQKQTLDEKRERKATITNISAASARKSNPEQPKPKTTADIIEEMRKSRGQA